MKLLLVVVLCVMASLFTPLKAQLPSERPPLRLYPKYYKGNPQQPVRLTNPNNLPSARTSEMAAQMAKLRPVSKNENKTLSPEERKKRLPSNSKQFLIRPKPKHKSRI